ncbi:MAG: peptidyl-prolyl cis-trans isomerase [Gammaproteobacteria bacterium]|nr:peptidyl-prolyl cis-trans isomerase [Gammaproteobacteria bacterium]
MFTNKGSITLELNQAKAPKTVKNFLRYAEQGFYNGTIFHRVIPGFMIQGGGFEVGMNKKETHPAITNEANNGLKNQIGTIAMARTGDPHSATAQFFINVGNNEEPLDHTSKTSSGWGYTVFGKVTEGMEIVKAIENTRTTSYKIYSDVPSSDIIIEKVEIIQ